MKSDGATARLSVTVKFWSQRRVYPTSTETRGRTSCCTVAVICQSDGRLYQPFRICSSYERLETSFPKFALLHAPQKSPPVGAQILRQAVHADRNPAVKLRLASVHVRVTLLLTRLIGRSSE